MDKYNLAGFKLTQEQKDAFNNLSIVFEKLAIALRKAIQPNIEALKKLNIVIAESREKNYASYGKKVKPWNKSKFYE